MNKQNNSERLRKCQRGFGIVTVMLGIVASAIITVIGYETYTHVMNKIKVDRAHTQIQDISTGVDSLYSNSHDYTGINTQMIIDAGIVKPSDIVGSNIVSPWYSSDASSIVTVSQGTQPSSYTIEMASIPQKSCSDVGSVYTNDDSVSLSVNGSEVTDIPSLVSACASSESSDVAVSF